MKRTPVRGASLPPCYGLTPRKHTACKTCAEKLECIAQHLEWRVQTSVAQQLQCALDAATPATSAADYVQVYRDVYRDVFGEPVWRMTQRASDTLRRVKDALDEFEDIDWALFVTANMLALRATANEKPHGFQPNWLAGERARGRYNAYLRKTYRRNRTLDAAPETPRVRFRSALYVSEQAVGAYVVALRLRGERVGVAEAVDAVDLTPEWIATQLRGACPDWLALVSSLDVAVVEQEVRIAQLHATVTVLDSYQPTWSSRVGIREWSWEAVADFVEERVTVVRKAAVNLDGIPGDLWGQS